VNKPILVRVLVGGAAGVVATAAMSLCMLAARRVGALGEPPPRRIVRRLTGLGSVLRGRASLDAAALAAHFAFGAGLGCVYALLPARARTPLGGRLFGLGVWASHYGGILPSLGLMPSPSHDRPLRPTVMVLSHWIFGGVLAASERQLTPIGGELRGKVAVVAGGSRGLGRVIARELAQRGARVAICGRSAPALERTRAWLERDGLSVLSEVVDLRLSDQVDAFVEKVSHELGPIDILVANAASIDVSPIECLTAADFDAAVSEIFGSAVRVSLAVLPSMRARRRGTLTYIGSLGGRFGVPHLAPYSAAKFALRGFAEALHAEVAADGVHVLNVSPGLMRTGSHLHARFRGKVERELGWFGAAAIAPVVSIATERAARYIVRSIARQDRFLVYTPAARLGIWLHDVLPGLWSSLAALAGLLLPRANWEANSFERREGAQVMRESSSRLIRLIGARSAPLAVRYGQ
jgi:NAD(P)-dependent dehydrogenase (short-subunit alcohol dehydrogenase family)